MTQKKIAILASGYEIISGRLIDTNSAWVSKFVQELGYEITYFGAADDNSALLKELILFALRFNDIVIMTGGLGPTEDDKTRFVLAEILNTQLEFHEQAKEQMLNYFQKIGRNPSSVPKSNNLQCMLPKGSEYIPNLCGTACGILCQLQGKTIVAMPGVPHEMKSMFSWLKDNKTAVLPRVRSANITKVMTLFGVSEARIGERIAEDMKLNDPTISITAKTGYTQITISSFLESKVLAIFDKFQQLMKDCLISNEGLIPVEVLIDLCKKNQWKLGCIESCTGGLIADAFVSIAGASDVFCSGAVSYSNEAKISLANVKKETLEKYGAVSEEVAREMAYGFASQQKLDICLSTTGVAGPKGGSAEKPVGMVCFGVYINSTTFTFTGQFSGNRQEVRARSTNYVIGQTILKILNLI